MSGYHRLTLVPLLVVFVGCSLAACATTSSPAAAGEQTPGKATVAPDGAALYAQSCAACHGDTGRNGSAKHIAGHPAVATREVLKIPVGPMSSIKLSAEERDAVATYVAGLK